MEYDTDRELIRTAVFAVACIHNGAPRQLLPLCAQNALLKYGRRCGLLKNSIGELIPPSPGSTKLLWEKEPLIQRFGPGSAIVTGAYRLRPPDAADDGACGWDYTILFSGRRIACVQLSRLTSSQRLHRVHAVDKTVYCLSESDILYLEVLQGHLHWHHRDRTVESLGTLSDAAQALSDDFVRVHRCYIVNKDHVASIGRCGAKRCALTMVNGDVIPIPYDKYVACRERLTR